MKQGDIVWVRLPFSDLERRKARPALVVSNDTYNDEHPDVVVCAITSNLQAGDYKVPIAGKDLDAGALPLSSMVRADKILQVEKAIIDRAFARVNAGTYKRVLARIHTLVARRKASAR